MSATSDTDDDQSNDYKPGDIIIDNCLPFVKAVNKSGIHKHCCNYCFLLFDQELTPCPDCELVYYCCKNCQMKDWNNGHSVECFSACFRDFCHQPGTKVEDKCMIFRLLALLKLKPESAKRQYVLHDGTTKCFDDLLADPKLLAKGTEMRTDCEVMASLINAENPGSNLETNYLQCLFGIQESNSYGVRDQNMTMWLGHAIYIEPCVLPHECKPTAVCVITGLKMQVRAIAHIEHGEKPSITFTNRILDRVERRKLLLERFHWECFCETCKFSTDVGTNYRRMSKVVGLMEKIAHDDSTYVWSKIYEHHQKTIQMLLTVYHQFDERVTNQFKTTFNIAMRQGVDLRLIESLLNDTRRQLLITYGKDHVSYKDFKEKINRAPSCSHFVWSLLSSDSVCSDSVCSDSVSSDSVCSGSLSSDSLGSDLVFSD